MKEKDLKIETNQENIKLEWEAPKLISLDKGKTQGGGATSYAEGATYNGTQS